MTAMLKTGSPNWFLDFTHRGEIVRRTSKVLVKQVGQTTKQTKREAEEVEKRWRDEIDARLDNKVAPRATLGEVMDRYFFSVIKPAIPEELLKDEVSINNLDYKKKARRILAHFGADKAVNEITAPAISAWADSMLKSGLLEHHGKGVWVPSATKGLKPRAINAYLSCLRAVLKRCAQDDWGFIATAPVVKMVKGKKKKVRFLEPEEANALIVAALPDRSANTDSLHLQQLIRFLLGTGARKSEALSLTWRNVNLTSNSNASVHFADTKTDEPRTVPVGDTLRDMLIEMKREQTKLGYTGKRVFVYFVRGEWLEINGVGSSFVTARTKAGLGDDVTLHTLRHTYASWMLQDDVDLKKVSELLGHASINMTADTYGHLLPKHLESSVNVLEKRMALLTSAPALQ